MSRDKDNDQFNNDDSFDFEKDLSGITFTDYETDTEIGFEGDSELEPAQTPEEFYPINGKKKKKKRKKKRYLLKFIIFLLVVAAVIFFLRSDFFDIDRINVLNNEHYTKEQIIEISQLKVGDNLFEFTAKGKVKTLTKDPYIKTAEVKRILPDALEIKVNERQEKIVIPYKNKFVVTDYEGMVLRVADKAPDLTLVSNLVPKAPKPGTALDVTETEILTDTLSLLKEVEKVDMYFKKIYVNQHSVKAYIYDSLVVEGNYDNIADNLKYLSKVMADLHKQKVKRGTIKVSGNGYCSFQPEV